MTDFVEEGYMVGFGVNKKPCAEKVNLGESK